ncbi:hypothetical protein TeGR_g1410 [Tetraparma gracilis]|uniref:gamma-glutamylcyclotransferase n=1 Tax=Tetraparma gracilis TaxID=2962635 RepID=A0ABQ6MLN8_9STRA|nr:hypothetical protein TeGR_g1410 [Tetraparma gracilis]
MLETPRILCLLLLLLLPATYALPPPPPARPALLSSPSPNVFYFAVGSNLLQSKLANRSSNSTISFLSFEPASVEGHRLAFNLRGFPPLEPGMGGIEPCAAATIHGALVCLPRAEYEKVWRSEGGGSKNPGYEEYVVTARPYATSSAASPEVQAVAFRARPHVRLPRDASPSRRYLNILLEGARELKLDPAYQLYLEQIPTQNPSRILRSMSLTSFFFTGILFRLQLSYLIKPVTYLLWRVYAPASSSRARLLLSEAASALVLLPTFALGLGVRLLLKLTGKPLPPMMKLMMDKAPPTPPAPAPAPAPDAP